MVKTICFFNHKGGVSKTTSTFTLAWVLAEAGKRVLMVDCDPQCNLSGLVLGYDFIDDEELESFYLSRQNLTLYTLVESIKNTGNCDFFLKNENGKIIQTDNKNLFLLPGHINISELNTQINVAITMTGSILALRNIPGALPKAIKTIASNNNIDYVLYDLAPSINGVNEVLLLSSDYFIVPSAPDYFSWQAINSLKKILPAWHEEIATFKSRNNFNSELYPIPNKPQFLGLIQQRYIPKSNKPSEACKMWMDIIHTAVTFVLVPTLQKIGCVVEEEKIRKSLEGSGLFPYNVACIPDFSSVLTISQQVAKPIFTWTEDEISKISEVYGIEREDICENRDTFVETYTALGKRILELTQS